MVRKLKHHERKLLKKFDFINWECDNNLHEVKIMKRYHIQRREDYTLYNKLSRQIRDLANKLKDIDETDQWRAEMTQLFTTKLHNLGLVPTKRSLMLASKVNASCFCRRRLPVILMRSHMAETMKTAVTFVEQGHVRVGPDVITDPAFLVTRSMEDYITWAPQSKIRKRIEEYNGIRDDYNDV
ncbi:U3 small nucleolar ribonucleoprotein IMP3 [Paragonimus heterotremus]|uniref:U3 small nucleolar ribonucleoprotein protein IMP3 n=1 Tax=Paragonimus heterotremus TaxID=100268 RepID=A0A8J4SQ04_9TREM|nr:U3 small nucleolar ribonucleoprotein IMP3 [Paragonimus heterotremus]